VSEPAAGLTALLEGVAEEAQREADGIVGAARARAADVLARAEHEAALLEAEAEAEGRREGEREARRRVALARIEARQDELRQREAEVDGAIERARRRIEERADGADAEGLLAALVAGAARALGERRVRVRVRAQDAPRLAAAAPDLDLELTVDPEPLAEAGALVSTEDGRRFVDATISGIARLRRPSARRAAARVLFVDSAK
jgi:vacuolar-type H+-ATPase subunit E/Vma4